MASQINLQDLYFTVNSDGTGSLSTTQPVSLISYTIVLRHFNNELITLKWDKDDLNTLTTTGKITGFVGLQNSLFGLSSDFVGKHNIISYDKTDYATSPKSGSNEGTVSNASSNEILIEQNNNVYINLMNAQNAMQQNNCYSMQIAFTKGETLPNTNLCYVNFRGLVSDDVTMGNIQVSITGVNEQTTGQTTYESDYSITVETGSIITITINSAQGYSFKEYSYSMGDVSQTLTNNPLSITVTDNLDIKFSFEEQTPQAPDNPENPLRFVTVTIDGLENTGYRIYLVYTFNNQQSFVTLTETNSSNNQIPVGSKCTFSPIPNNCSVQWKIGNDVFEGEQYTIPDIQENITINVDFLSISTFSLSVRGFVDSGWKISAYPTNSSDAVYEFTANDQIYDIAANTQLSISFERTNNDTYYCLKQINSNGVTLTTYTIVMTTNITLECIFEKLQISLNSLEHWHIDNLLGGTLTNNIISNIKFGSTVSFDIVTDENYTINKCTITRFGITTPLNTQHIVIEDIKDSCSLFVSLIKDHVTPDVVISGEAEQKHYRFKVKYKNSDSEIWIDWYANVFNYITNE